MPLYGWESANRKSPRGGVAKGMPSQRNERASRKPRKLEPSVPAVTRLPSEGTVALALNGGAEFVQRTGYSTSLNGKSQAHKGVLEHTSGSSPSTGVVMALPTVYALKAFSHLFAEGWVDAGPPT